MQTPNGDTGGDGRTWSTNDQTILRRYNPLNGDGFGGDTDVLPPPQLVSFFGPDTRPDLYTYDLPYSPGDSIDLNPGDNILTPPNSTVTPVLDSDGNQIAEIFPGIPALIEESGTTTAPTIDPNIKISITDRNLPILDNGTYPVMLKICSVFVNNGGIGYSEGDKITVTPDNGAILEPVIGPFGAITSVKVINSGYGFTEYPTINIESDTGYNAELIPYLCISNLGDLPEPEREELTRQGKIIKVVDCVGKI